VRGAGPTEWPRTPQHLHTVSVPATTTRLSLTRRTRFGELGLRGICAAAVLVLLAVMAMLIWEVARGAHLSFSAFGLGFVTSTEWNAVTNEFGALYLLEGTLLTSIFALIIAVPTAIAIGLFLSELAPRVLRTPVGLMVELLAAIPSVILGLWGIVVLGPFVATHVEPWLNEHLGFIPLFSGYPSNAGILPACLILTIMMIPIIASISRELFNSVPSELKQGALALGATRWEVMRQIAIPQVSGGLIAAVMLGFARAIGEAIAVAQVIGSHNASPFGSIFKPAATMASWIATQFNGTATDLQRSSLYYLAVILLVISLVTNIAAQLIVNRIQKRMGVRA
jgi:phosphate transport system permease protein